MSEFNEMSENAAKPTRKYLRACIIAEKISDVSFEIILTFLL